MNDRSLHWELAESYVAGSLTAAGLQDLKERLEVDAAFAASFKESVQMVRALRASAKQQQFKLMLGQIREKVATENAPQPADTTVIPLRTHYWRTAGIAASIAVITSLSTLWFSAHNQKKNASQYDLLRRELETIKTSQRQIITNINNQQTPAPMLPASYSGTGFAVATGFIVTNYHVTEGADSIYLQDKRGGYHKAAVVSFDAKHDVALLQVQSPKAMLGKGDVPYTFASGKRGLGARVFTLGFPQDEIVYNEGYISSKNGFQGDSMQYQLELPASFGQSGAPVVDASGSIIGIVTAKQGEAGVTYAVSSKAILQLLKNLPDDLKVNLPKTNKLGRSSREQQIEKLEDYTFQVRVYKR